MAVHRWSVAVSSLLHPTFSTPDSHSFPRVEGVLTAGLALTFAFVLPDFPRNARGFFSDAERKLAQARLEEDAKQSDEDVDATSRWEGFVLAVRDPKTWLITGILYLECKLAYSPGKLWTFTY
jgi:hypothetical protein